MLCVYLTRKSNSGNSLKAASNVDTTENPQLRPIFYLERFLTGLNREGFPAG